MSYRPLWALCPHWLQLKVKLLSQRASGPHPKSLSQIWERDFESGSLLPNLGEGLGMGGQKAETYSGQGFAIKLTLMSALCPYQRLVWHPRGLAGQAQPLPQEKYPHAHSNGQQ
jgi:hypothetical protein